VNRVIAITRGVATTIGNCELTHVGRTPIDVDRARDQHRQYEQALTDLGCEVRRIPADDRHPDCVFIEDTAVVLDELAIITRPGAPSRRQEADAVAGALRDLRPIVRIEEPATIDGGDVLRVDRTLFVGMSARTNSSAIEQLRRVALSYEVIAIPIDRALHLKSAVTLVAPNTLLVNPEWIGMEPFRAYDRIEVDPTEPFAANALLVGGAILYPSDYPRTRERLETRGLRVVTVDASELAKAEGGVTCCSVLIGDR
jgi:dimethylargininase